MSNFETDSNSARVSIWTACDLHPDIHSFPTSNACGSQAILLAEDGRTWDDPGSSVAKAGWYDSARSLVVAQYPM